MAWLQNLAGKAEDLLNKIDQNAANVLNESSKNLENSTSLIESGEPNQNYPVQQALYHICNEQTNSNLFESGVKDSSSTSDKSQLETDDEAIFLSLDKKEEEHAIQDTSNQNTKSASPSSPKTFSPSSFHVQEDTQTYDDEDKLIRYEREMETLIKQLLNLQHLYSELQNDNLNLQNQVERANESVTLAQNEMEQYKSRAQRILQEKESLILQKHETENLTDGNILYTYNEELRHELEFQQEKNKELSEKIVSLKNDLIGLQQQYVKVQNSNQQSIHNLQELLDNERKIRLVAEDDCRIKTKELQVTLIELTRHQINLRNVSSELDKMKNKLKESASFKTNDDSESRLHSLTQTLMTKQNTLETITTERNALRIQLEKLENEYHRVLLQNQRKHVISDINDTDDAKSQVPRLMVVSPFDAGVTRRVKHAYSTLDAISIRTGVFLRRYPLARIFVFCYMILLHIWMLVILYTYVPSSY